MKAIRAFLNDATVRALLLILLVPIVGVWGEQLKNVSWLAWMQSVPQWGWLTLVAIVVVLVISRAVALRMKTVRASNTPILSIFERIPAQTAHIGDFPYSDVIWRVYAEMLRRGIYGDLSPVDWSTHYIRIQTPPRCPKCGTELEEIRRFFRGWIWACIGCGFRRQNRDSFHVERNRVERLVRRDLETENFQPGKAG